MLAAIFLGLDAQAARPTFFVADFTAQEAVEISGELALEAQPPQRVEWWPRGGIPAEPILELDRARVRVWELAEDPVSDRLEILTDADPRPAEEFESTRLAVNLVALGPRAQWSAFSVLGPDAGNATLRVACMLVAPETSGAPPGDGRMNSSDRMPHFGRIVRGDCNVAATKMTSLDLILLDELTLRLQDEEGRDRVLRLGRFEENATAGGPRPIRRYLEIEATGDAAALRYDGAAQVRFEHPAPLLAGVLSMPAVFDGRVEWGEATFDDQAPTHDPEGVFAFRSGGAWRMTIDGTTHNAAVSEAAVWRGIDPAVAVGISIALVVVAAIVWAIRAGPLGFFSRSTEADLSAHPVRRALLDYVERHPGCTIRDAAKATGVSHRVASYHVNVLASARAIRIRRLGRRTTALCTSGSAAAHDLQAAAELRKASTQRIVQFIEERPGATQAQIASALGVTQQYVSQILGRLRRLGVLTKGADGRTSVQRIMEA